MPVTLVQSKWDSGALVFHDANDYGAGAEILRIDPAIITFGTATNDVDFKVWVGAAAYVTFDYGTSTMTIYGVDVSVTGDITVDTEDIKLGDNDSLEFGDATGGDINILWDTDSLNIIPATDNTGTIEIGNGTADIDVKWFGGTTSKYVLFDNDIALLQLEDVDLKLGDNDILQFGDASGGDVSIKWDANSLNIIPAADNTGAIEIGSGTADIDVKIFMGLDTKYVLFDNDLAIVYLEDTDLRLGDADQLQFGDGTGGDVVMQWESDRMNITAVANTMFALGAGAVGVDLRLYSSADGDRYLTWDASADELLFHHCDLRLEDNDYLIFGDGSDAKIYWTDAWLAISAAANTLVAFGAAGAGLDARFYSSADGNRYLSWDASADALKFHACSMYLEDADFIYFGTSDDMALVYDGGDNKLQLYTQTTGTFQIYVATTLSANLTFSGARDIIIPAATASALEFYDSTTKFIAVDSRIDTSAATMLAITCMPASFVAASGSTRKTVSIAPGTTTLTGSTGVTDMGGCGLYISAPTITDADAVTVTRASTVLIEGMPVEGGNVTITQPYALRVTGTTASDSRNTLVEFFQTIGANVTGQTATALRLYTNTDGTSGRTIGNFYGARIEAALKHASDSVTGLTAGLQIIVELGTTASGGTVNGLDMVMQNNGTRATSPNSFVALNDHDYAGSCPVQNVFDFGGQNNELSTGAKSTTACISTGLTKATARENITAGLKIRANSTTYWVALLDSGGLA